MIRNNSDGIIAYVLGTRITLANGKPNEETLIVGKMNLPKMVMPIPRMISNIPTSQNQKPNMVQGFLVKVLSNVIKNNNTQIPAKTNKPINNASET